MIYTPAGGGTPRAVVGKQMFTVGSTGSTIITPATTNRINPTPGFAFIDDIITRLDASYEQLPNKADWETAAAAYAGSWSLCANCNVPLSGKKLFRQVNFWKQIASFPVTTVVPLGGPPALVGVVDIVVQVSTWPNFTFINVNTDIANGGFFWVAQVGQAASNPQVLANPLDFNGSITVGPLWQWAGNTMLAITKGIEPPPFTQYIIGLCTYSATGWPGNTLPCRFTYNH